MQYPIPASFHNCSVKRCRDRALYKYFHFYIIPCLHTFWHAISAFLQFECFYFLVTVLFLLLTSVMVRPKPKKDISFKYNHNPKTWTGVDSLVAIVFSSTQTTLHTNHCETIVFWRERIICYQLQHWQVIFRVESVEFSTVAGSDSDCKLSSEAGRGWFRLSVTVRCDWYIVQWHICTFHTW